jgi:hypothetical protein
MIDPCFVVFKNWAPGRDERVQGQNLPNQVYVRNIVCADFIRAA